MTMDRLSDDWVIFLYEMINGTYEFQRRFYDMLQKPRVNLAMVGLSTLMYENTCHNSH